MKLGPHHMMGGSDTRRWMIEARPSVAKFVGDLGASNDAPPGILCVGRIVDDGQINGQGFDANRMASQLPPMEAARLYVELLRPYILSNPRIDVWEFANEQVVTTHAVMAWYGAACYEFARLIQGLGKRAGLGGWATGTPAPELWHFYQLALEATRQFNAVLTRHEYGPLDGHLSLRYRNDQAVFDSMGYRAMPLIVSECGADSVPGMQPWRIHFVTMERYWQELLRPYTVEIERDAYVLGATVFTCGGGGGANAWHDFDVSGTGLVDRVIAYADGLAEPPPTGEDEMTPEQAQQVMAELDKIDAATEAVRALVAEFLAPPWWQKPVPYTFKAAPVNPLKLYRPDRVTVGASLNYTGWEITVSQVDTAGWLLVVDLPGDAGDLWLRVGDVTPV